MRSNNSGPSNYPCASVSHFSWKTGANQSIRAYRISLWLRRKLRSWWNHICRQYVDQSIRLNLEIYSQRPALAAFQKISLPFNAQRPLSQIIGPHFPGMLDCKYRWRSYRCRAVRRNTIVNFLIRGICAGDVNVRSSVIIHLQQHKPVAR